MPEEEASVPTGNGASQKNEKGHHNSKRLLYLFRFKYRKKSSSKSSKKTLTNSTSVTPVLTTTTSTNPEERRDKLDRDMKSNWEELPTTLRRRKEKLSAAVLAEFHSDDTPAPGVEPEEVVAYDSSIEKIEEGPVTQIVVAEINDHYAELCFGKSPKLSKKYVPEDRLSNSISISDDESPTISKNKVSEDKLSSNTSNSDHERSDSPCLDQDNDSLECVQINSNSKVEDNNEERNSKENGIGVTLSLNKCSESYAQEKVAHYGKSHKRSASCTHQDVCNNKIYEVLAPVEQENKSVKDLSLMELKKLKDDLQEVLQSTPNVHDESCQSDYFVAAVNCEDPSETSNDQNCLETPSKSDETNKSPLPTEETLQSSIRKDTTLNTSHDPTPLKMEELHVIRLLSRAVSEDSLIMSSGSEEHPSSNSASEDEDQHSHHDSGTDINNPSSSSSSCSEEAPEIAPPPAESRQGSDDSGVDDKVSCWKSCTSSSSSGTKTSAEESPLSQQVEEDNSSTYVSFANLHGSDHSIYEEVGNLHIPRVGYQAGKLEKMKVEVEKLAAPTAEEDAMSYYDAVALDRKSPDANKSKMYASLENVRSVGGANSYHKSNFTTAETKNYFVYNSGIKSEGNDVISEGETNKFIIVEQRECIESETKSLTKTISLKKELLDAGTVVTKLCDVDEQSDTDKGALAKRYSTTTWDEDEGGSGARHQDACGRWKKQETLIHRRNPRMMATILEEGDSGGGGDDRTCTKLSVREILKKFEELGGRMCPQGGEGEEKSATLREIQETLRCLEEKVRHYEASRENSPDQLSRMTDDHLDADRPLGPVGVKGSAPPATDLEVPGSIPGGIIYMFPVRGIVPKGHHGLDS
uniref:Uncharacterized protein n=1 Tax=Timema monikensis TaxID=170555 RepID=A0A7R9HHU0_9NEOP|nr:unnamed protein product [Timema monikensis]